MTATNPGTTIVTKIIFPVSNMAEICSALEANAVRASVS